MSRRKELATARRKTLTSTDTQSKRHSSKLSWLTNQHLHGGQNAQSHARRRSSRSICSSMSKVCCHSPWYCVVRKSHGRRPYLLVLTCESLSALIVGGPCIRARLQLETHSPRSSRVCGSHPCPHGAAVLILALMDGRSKTNIFDWTSLAAHIP